MFSIASYCYLVLGSSTSLQSLENQDLYSKVEELYVKEKIEKALTPPPKKPGKLRPTPHPTIFVDVDCVAKTARDEPWLKDIKDSKHINYYLMQNEQQPETILPIHFIIRTTDGSQFELLVIENRKVCFNDVYVKENIWHNIEQDSKIQITDSLFYVFSVKEIDDDDDDDDEEKQIRNKPVKRQRLSKEVEWDCSICLDMIVNCAVLRCGHSFCKLCVLTSLTVSPRCPLCREDQGFLVPIPHLRADQHIQAIVEESLSQEQKEEFYKRKSLHNQEMEEAEKTFILQTFERIKDDVLHSSILDPPIIERQPLYTFKLFVSINRDTACPICASFIEEGQLRLQIMHVLLGEDSPKTNYHYICFQRHPPVPHIPLTLEQIVQALSTNN